MIVNGDSYLKIVGATSGGDWYYDFLIFHINLPFSYINKLHVNLNSLDVFHDQR